MPEPECPEDPTLAVSWAPGYEIAARSFANENGLPIINEFSQWRGLCFELTAHGWQLQDASGEMGTPFSLEFSARRVSPGRDPLLRALGKCVSVLDLTAGWAGDALHMAASGRTVTAVERNPVVHQLLLQAQRRLSDAELADRLRFLHMDAAAPDFAEQIALRLGVEPDFELVYLDPMFVSKKAASAKSRKPMRLMQRLAEMPSEENEHLLLTNALKLARRRVVVKRASKAPCLDERRPQGSIRSKLLRFDLYLP